MAGHTMAERPKTERDVDQKSGKYLLMEQCDCLEQQAYGKDGKLKGEEELQMLLS